MVYLEGIGVVFKYETYESNHSMVLVKIKSPYLEMSDGIESRYIKNTVTFNDDSYADS